MKLHGMKKVCQESRYAGQYPIYIWVNRRTGEVFGHIDSVRPSEDWNDKDIRFVCSRRDYMTMAEICEEAERTIRESYKLDKEHQSMEKHLAEENAKAKADEEKRYERWKKENAEKCAKLKEDWNAVV